MSSPLIVLHSRPTTHPVTSRLFCFHWSGGNVNSFKNWANTVESQQSNTEIYGVTWRSRNQVYCDVKQVVTDLRQTLFDLRLLDPNIKIIFFGHSLGGIIAFELVRQLESESYNIQHLFVSAVKHPTYLTDLNRDDSVSKRYKDTEDELFKHIQGIGGLPAGVHPDFLKMSLKGIKQDYVIFETYLYDKSMTVLGSKSSIQIICPITSMSGHNDFDVPESAMTQWSTYTAAYQTHYCFGDASKGDHFFVNDPSFKLEVLAIVFSICSLPPTQLHTQEVQEQEEQTEVERRNRVSSIHPIIANF